jgi:N-acyl-L-homoserine lactone synthetase
MIICKRAETPDELLQVYQLRYQVYCLEKRFEPVEKFPEQLETDEYDNHSINLIALKDSMILGTVRLINDNPMGFPVERYCGFDFSRHGISRENTVEISRFIISRENAKIVNVRSCDIIASILSTIQKETRDMNTVYLCAAMGRGMQKLLSRIGIIFFQAGPLVDYHGLRAPYVSGIRLIEESIFTNNFELFSFMNSPRFIS